MRVDSPYIMICHSIGNFFDPIGDTSKGWQGKYVSFIGDRQEGRDPFAIVLPEEAWTWTVPLIESNEDLIVDFYKNDANYGRLYSAIKPSTATSRQTRGGGEGKRKQDSTGGASKPNECILPLLLSLPNCLTKQLINQAYWMPAT